MGIEPEISPAANLPPLMSSADVMSFLGVCNVTIWRLEKRGEFPPAIRMGRVKRWQREDILAYVQSRKAA